MVGEVSISTKIGETLTDFERHIGPYLWSPYVIGQTMYIFILSFVIGPHSSFALFHQIRVRCRGKTITSV